MESMMSVRQVAELLGVHENWVYDHAASGDLPSYKIGGVRRFIRDEVLGWIAALREPEHKRPESHRRAPQKTPNRTADRRRAQDGERQSRAATSPRRDDPQPRLFE